MTVKTEHMTKDEALKLDALIALVWIFNQKTGGLIQRKAMEAIAALEEALTQPEQKPVGKLMPCKEGWFADIDNPPPLGAHEGLLLYTSPNAVEPQQKREWVGLTDAQVIELRLATPTQAEQWGNTLSIAKALSSKLRELNT